jgi:hypothetical protein
MDIRIGGLAVDDVTLEQNASGQAQIKDDGVTIAKILYPGWSLIEKITEDGSSNASITFSSLGTYDGFMLIYVIEGNNASNDSVVLRFNADSGNNYSEQYISSGTSGENTGAIGITVASNDNRYKGAQVGQIIFNKNAIGSTTNGVPLVLNCNHTNNGNRIIVVSGEYTTATDITSVSLVATNNIKGNFYLYGMGD